MSRERRAKTGASRIHVIPAKAGIQKETWSSPTAWRCPTRNDGKRLAGSKGLTLIEMIVFIVVAGIFVPLAYIAFSNAVKGAATPEAYTKARLAAEQKMEELTSLPFANIAAMIPSGQTFVTNSGTISGYTTTWTIRYVDYTPKTVMPPPTTLTIVNAGEATKYISIKVEVTVQGAPYAVYTIVTNRT